MCTVRPVCDLIRIGGLTKKHCSRGCRGGPQLSMNNSSGGTEDEDSEPPLILDDPNTVDNDDQAIVSHNPSQVWHEAAFILSVKERHVLSQAAVDHVILSASMLVQGLLKTVLMDLKADGLPQSSVETVEHRLSQVENSLFSRLGSAYLQEKSFKEEFNIVNPKRIVMGTRRIWRTRRRSRRIIEVKDAFQYIPLLESLKAMLRKPDILVEVQSGHKSSSNVLRDYCDGDWVLTQLMFQSDPEALMLVFYYDDLEIANPLGSKKGKHKLGVFYWMLVNIHPAYRSGIHYTQLLAVAYSKDIRNYGIDTILKPAVDDLKTLATEGIDFNIADRHYHFRGGLVAFLGDTPAMGLIGGFKEGVGGANRCCRSCMITTSELSIKLKQEELQPRNVVQHKLHCELVETPDCGASFSVEYGVNRLSILDQAPLFDVCQCIPFDVMHVILEGVLPRHLRLLLKRCIVEEHYFTIHRLNQCISCFCYGYSEICNIPSPVDRDRLMGDSDKLGQTASQMWLLGRLLPLLIGRFIPESDVHWRCYGDLLKILVICTAVEVTEDSISTLSLLVEDYLYQYNTLYPGTMTPKLHYLLHLPQQMKKFGPLRHQWCMRLEAKHSYIKSLVHKNFKNLPYTVAVRHQRNMCRQMLAPPGLTSNFLYHGDIIHKAETLLADTLPLDVSSEFEDSSILCATSAWTRVPYWCCGVCCSSI